MALDDSYNGRNSPIAPTMEMDLSPTPRRRWRCHIVEGTQSQRSQELNELLRRRLLASAVVIFTGATLFFVWMQWSKHGPVPDEFRGGVALINGFHLAFTIVEGICALWLASSLCISSRWLRVFESVIFGVPAAFFATLTWTNVSMCCTAGDQIEIVAASLRSTAEWVCLIVMYGMFIPNTWRRAALVVVPMAILPIALMALQRWTMPAVAEVLTFDDLVGHGLMLLVACMIAVYGTYNIHALRTEVFEARQLGQYTLRELIGSGGMGQVYLGEHQLLKRPCAIKLIQPGQAADPRALARFEREVNAAAKLSHWNSIEIFDYGRTDDGTFYYVMEYLPGLSISDLVTEHGPLTADRVVHLLRQTCHALREAHGQGLIHRDIKPGNIFAAQRGGVFDVAKLLDFGLVKTLDPQSQPIDITQEGSITGSPLYMSPEQATGSSEPDARSDIYSLGAVAYFMLTGRPPFDGTKPMEVLIAHARDEVVPPSHLQSGIPSDLEEVVLRCLAKRPEDRYGSADELEQALANTSPAGLWSDERAEQWWRQISAEPVAEAV